ncbi:hypothetical protein BDV96DRAFT_561647 [Lophiotrema nucula]|uniref:Ams2/SPT21 N-terminal domain-containing protein n=1 Tax=Lophiotrema nucula TaxID=690887 RepID=A0A6A5ZX04_9PLEO|nr:hypothetical protein BDV96DRAFT_561647 [Lophiotrema nucula]
MSAPPNARGYHSPPPQHGDRNEGGVGDEIPRRLMRVKVLYTFDDQNKSNCLARLPNALSIPTVPLDESTFVGVIELKTCIQAIVAASPELVAKLGHDYTVYAYDYSEYETPLVGQGMLSWILASASSTPNAPAHQSQTMVTGRVCKNIMGLFSNGIRDTLEVKLKLVPVPTSIQKEYVENMERYHNLSQRCPEGFDYSSWKEFLRMNPTLAQMAQARPETVSQWHHEAPMDGRAPPQQMQQYHMPPMGEGSRPNMFMDQRSHSHHGHETRPSSPALSTASYNPYYGGQDSRPGSRTSFRSETAAHMQRHNSFSDTLEFHNEEGPPKKRARVTKAKRPKNTPLAAPADLRMTASTAASLRMHKPIATNPASAIAAAEQVPRAPTPRPGDAKVGFNRQFPRAAPPSLLRNPSTDDRRDFPSHYESTPFSDNAIDSADDERGPSPAETPMDIPSSPPIMPQRMESPAPSSPGLPTLPEPADSGFVSDLPQGREEGFGDSQSKLWSTGALPPPAETRIRARQDRSHHPWKQANPGPPEMLPQSYVPKPKAYPRPRQTASSTEKTQPAPRYQELSEQAKSRNGSLAHDYQPVDPVEQELLAYAQARAREMIFNVRNSDHAPYQPTEIHSRDIHPPQMPHLVQGTASQDPAIKAGSPDDTGMNAAFPEDNEVIFQGSRSATPNLPPVPPKASKPRGLPRSHTWSGPLEPMSDSAEPSGDNSKNPRSGAGAKRKQHIVDKMNASIEAGQLPPYCNNCGEIQTPTWRKAYTRLEPGEPAPVTANPDGTGIIAVQFVTPGTDGQTRHRIFKNVLAKDENSSLYEHLNLCNPCGLWLKKRCAMRPAEVWAKNEQGSNSDKPKRRRSKKKVKGDDEIMSDAMVPHSDVPVMHGSNEVPASIDGSADLHMQPTMRSRTSSFQFGTGNAGTEMEESAAAAALRRAIQSSPGGFRGSRDTPISLEPELTPKPTRRLLFPSPRKSGEVKTLGDFASESPTNQPMMRKTAESPVPLPDMELEDIDKENCPPPNDHDDDLAHLFEDTGSTKTTPTKGGPLQELLKTPTPGSRRRPALTPRRGIENNADPTFPPMTPSRILRTPNRRAPTVAPVTPFTAQLNALLSDCIQASSPSQAQDIDFSNLPTFTTPGRNYNDLTANFDFSIDNMGGVDDFLSSDLPVPSSPPGGMNRGLGFSLYEDPDAATVGLWSGQSLLGSDSLNLDDLNPEAELHNEGSNLKISEISVDFAAMIESVVSEGSGNGKESASPQQHDEQNEKEPVSLEQSVEKTPPQVFEAERVSNEEQKKDKDTTTPKAADTDGTNPGVEQTTKESDAPLVNAEESTKEPKTATISTEQTTDETNAIPSIAEESGEEATDASRPVISTTRNEADTAATPVLEPPKEAEEDKAASPTKTPASSSPKKEPETPSIAKWGRPSFLPPKPPVKAETEA